MVAKPPADPDPAAAEALLADVPLGLEALAWVRSQLSALGPYEVRTTRTQVAFRRHRTFALLWCPGRWLARPGADVVLSLALDHEDRSGRWKEVVHPSARVWMHHLELRRRADLDDEVAGWLAQAHRAAG